MSRLDGLDMIKVLIMFFLVFRKSLSYIFTSCVFKEVVRFQNIRVVLKLKSKKWDALEEYLKVITRSFHKNIQAIKVY